MAKVEAETTADGDDAPRRLAEEVSAPRALDRTAFTKSLSYNLHGRWGLVETPAMHDAESVARQAFRDYQFLRPQAVYEILSHAFDNVANYARNAGYSKGEVFVGEIDGVLVFRVLNESSTRLPTRLVAAPITPADGVLHLERGERHPTESGGGNGLHFMTSYLKWAYRSDVVKTDKQASLRWFEMPAAEKGKVTAVFELRIPIPSREEQRELIERQELEAKIDKSFAAAEEVLGRWRAIEPARLDPTLLEREINVCCAAMELFCERQKRGLGERDLRVHKIYEGLAGLGKLAAAAAPALRNCIVHDVSSCPAETALRAVETDPEASAALFGKELPRLLKEWKATKSEDREKDDNYGPLAIRAIAGYAKDSGVKGDAFTEACYACWQARIAFSDMSAALAVRPLPSKISEEMYATFDAAVKDPVENKFLLYSLLTIFAGHTAEDPSIAVRMMDLLFSKEHSYEACKILKKCTQAQECIARAGEMLAGVAVPGEKREIYYLAEFIKGVQGDKSVLFPPLRAIFLDARYSYYACELLGSIGLRPEQIEQLALDVASALEVRMATKSDEEKPDTLSHHIMLLMGFGKSAAAARDVLVNAAIAGVEDYTAAAALKEIGITPEQFGRVREEIVRRKRAGVSTFALELLTKD